MKNLLLRHLQVILLLNVVLLQGQKTVLQLDAGHVVSEIEPTMYGIFFEDINFAADGGIYAEMVKNRGFEFDNPLMGWLQPNTRPYTFNPGSGKAAIVNSSSNHDNNFCRVTVEDDKGYVLQNEGFRGMGIKKDGRYRLSLRAANPSGTIKKIRFQLIDSTQQVLGETGIVPANAGWETYRATLVAGKTEAKAQLRITFEGSGIIDLDMISLFPEDTWKGRENGLRTDIVQLLADLHPGFLRFPGGCIVEGRTLAKRYQWKKTIGPLWDREILINRWNTEFGHRITPDYFQSFGLGFYEYFQLAEDLGAQPLPVLSCGMACQFNTGELVPVEELDPYVQDALDLIEFANGPANSAWGKVRADMGHPEPFLMKFIGIGNEQWGPDYIDRYKVFEKAIRDKYPEIVIVSSAGPFPEGDFFDFGMTELKKLNTEIVDEHYYNSPQWFRDNARRYDSYDRNGPKIFAGEYAAQSVGTTSPENKNNWECALSEAAFMTGLERNADIVSMTSYAPLLAHEEGWQWTPDLIWFNNLAVYGTPDYYVQKLFANHRGTHLLSIATPEGKTLAGETGLYASAVKDDKKGELYIKIVNVRSSAQTLELAIKNARVSTTAEVLSMTSGSLSDVNSFENPQKISPVEGKIPVADNLLAITVAPFSFEVVRLTMN